MCLFSDTVSVCGHLANNVEVGAKIRMTGPLYFGISALSEGVYQSHGGLNRNLGRGESITRVSHVVFFESSLLVDLGVDI